MLCHAPNAAPFLNSLFFFLIRVVRLPAAKIRRPANPSMAAMAEERFRSLAIVRQDKPFIPEEGLEDDLGFFGRGAADQHARPFCTEVWDWKKNICPIGVRLWPVNLIYVHGILWYMVGSMWSMGYSQYVTYGTLYAIYDVWFQTAWYMIYAIWFDVQPFVYSTQLIVVTFPTSPPIVSLSRKGTKHAARHLAVWALIAGLVMNLWRDHNGEEWGIWVARWKSSFSSNHSHARLEWRLDFYIFWYKIVTVLYKDQSQNLCKFARFNYVYLIEWHVHCTLHHT